MFVRVYGLQYPGYYCRHAADLRLAYVSRSSCRSCKMLSIVGCTTAVKVNVYDLQFRGKAVSPVDGLGRGDDPKPGVEHGKIYTPSMLNPECGSIIGPLKAARYPQYCQGPRIRRSRTPLQWSFRSIHPPGVTNQPRTEGPGPRQEAVTPSTAHQDHTTSKGGLPCASFR